MIAAETTSAAPADTTTAAATTDAVSTAAASEETESMPTGVEALTAAYINPIEQHAMHTLHKRE